jgi:predicted SAM-dependent methyltransferase
MTLKQRLGQWFMPRLPVSREFVRELRFEANSRLCGLRNALSPRYHRDIRRLRRQTGLSLNVGSGGRGLAGWINTDAVRHPADQSFACDVRRGVPLNDGSVRRIMAEHVVEHLSFRHELPGVLAEFLRLLEPGGMVRIVVPDGRRFTEAYLRNDPAAWAALGFQELPGDLPTPMALLNHVFRQDGEHHFAFDFATLEWALSRAGFASVRRCAFGESADPLLAIDRREHAQYSLYVEARKP